MGFGPAAAAKPHNAIVHCTFRIGEVSLAMAVRSGTLQMGWQVGETCAPAESIGHLPKTRLPGDNSQAGVLAISSFWCGFGWRQDFETALFASPPQNTRAIWEKQIRKLEWKNRVDRFRHSHHQAFCSFPGSNTLSPKNTPICPRKTPSFSGGNSCFDQLAQDFISHKFFHSISR